MVAWHFAKLPNARLQPNFLHIACPLWEYKTYPQIPKPQETNWSSYKLALNFVLNLNNHCKMQQLSDDLGGSLGYGRNLP
jgi:hypothetical protein